jgi:ABC-type phosphate transport system substrate-binding protein
MKIMATVYKLEIVSHWTNYTKDQLQKLLENAIKKDKELKKHKNEITIKVKERK